ncbi:MAG: hypothetical protein BMS9Abin29_2406 [Gemmatimonadota bacterium]|nr:MAG: hypothetical protein BMS9Abin29_2406 [Gemmatimonadota bacterium]
MRLVLELVIVFIGVYGAFLAESVRESREQEQIARNIYLALAEEIDDHVSFGQEILDEYVEAQTVWEESFERRERPPPWAIPWKYVGPPLAAWPATMASGGVGLMNQDLFYRLAKYYRNVDMLLVPVDGPDPFAESEILPYADGDLARFYDGPELRPRFRQYLDRRRIVLEGAQSTIDEGKVLLDELKARGAGDWRDPSGPAS